MMQTPADYLGSLTWDGTPRLDRWLIDCAGSEDTAHVRAVSRALLVAGVRRVRQPGCRHDQLPMLVGPQGAGKSGALHTLVGAGGVVEAPPLSDPQAVWEATRDKWVVEISELRHMESIDRWGLKEFLSRTHDAGHPRRFITVGTVNEEIFSMLWESSERRLLPVHVQRFNLVRLRSIRDQLWGEAVVAEATGESILVDTLTPAPAKEV